MKKQSFVCDFKPVKDEIYIAQIDAYSSSGELLVSKKRPVVVVGRNSSVTTDVTVIPLTSSKGKRPIVDTYVLLRKGTAQLAKDSYVRCEHITTIPCDRFKSYLGKVDNCTMDKIKDKLYGYLS